jgi:hypothetical protein
MQAPVNCTLINVTEYNHWYILFVYCLVTPLLSLPLLCMGVAEWLGPRLQLSFMQVRLLSHTPIISLYTVLYTYP